MSVVIERQTNTGAQPSFEFRGRRYPGAIYWYFEASDLPGHAEDYYVRTGTVAVGRGGPRWATHTYQVGTAMADVLDACARAGVPWGSIVEVAS